MAQEIENHLEMQIHDNLQLGMAPEEARRTAALKFGGIECAKESYRDQRGFPLLENLIQDLRYGLRGLRRVPGFAITIVLLLALGIGANITIFSLVYAVILHPLPYGESDRLAMLWIENPRKQIQETGTSFPTYLDWKSQSRSFQDFALCSRSHPVTLTGAGEPDRVESALVSANLTELMRVAPQAGRWISEEEEQRGERVVVLSYGLWQRRFGGSPGAIGRLLQIEGRNSLVIGVMPAQFQFPTKDTQFWEPYSTLPNWREVQMRRFTNFWRVIGRLRRGVTPEAAQVELNLIGQRLARQYPELSSNPDFPGFRVNIVTLPLQVAGKDVRLSLWVLLGAVSLVLLIACTNVAGILLARSAARKKEISVRIALGAGRWRIISQTLTESLILCVVGAIAGIVLASGCIRLLLILAPVNIARLDQAGINPAVLAYTVSTTLLVGILFSIVPALKASNTDPQAALAEGGRSGTGSLSGQKIQGMLVIAQVSLAIILLAGAGLLVRSFLQLRSVDPGFQADRVLSLRVVLWSKTEPQRAVFYKDTISRIQALPGVNRAAWVSNFFFSYNPDTTVIVEGRSSTDQAAREQVIDDEVSPGFFQTVGIPLLRGRDFMDRDAAKSTPVAVINETMVRRFWADEEPVGKRFQMNDRTQPWVTVVGVVGDTRRNGLERSPISQFFIPIAQSASRGADLVVRTSRDPLTIAAAVRGEIRAADPGVPISRLGTLERWMDEFMQARRFETVLLSLFSAAALVLSSVGIFGLLHYFVVQRKREIGLRMALGAQRRDILGMVLAKALRLCVAGTLIGLIGGIWITKVLSSKLFGVRSTDAVTWVLAAGMLVAASLAASFIPASRAAKADPLIALRDQD